jgi:hypothetical protein
MREAPESGMPRLSGDSGVQEPAPAAASCRTVFSSEGRAGWPVRAGGRLGGSGHGGDPELRAGYGVMILRRLSDGVLGELAAAAPEEAGLQGMAAGTSGRAAHLKSAARSGEPPKHSCRAAAASRSGACPPYRGGTELPAPGGHPASVPPASALRASEPPEGGVRARIRTSPGSQCAALPGEGEPGFRKFLPSGLPRDPGGRGRSGPWSGARLPGRPGTRG